MSTENQAPNPTANPREAAEVIQWHPGFWGAMELEFRENREDLEFQKEIPLTKESLYLDYMVVKLLSDVPLKNEIGRIFKKYNVFEYKSPEDGLTIDDYFKTLAYACLVKSSGHGVNEIPAKELTVTFLRDSYPRKMLKTLADSGAKIKQKYPGVYYIKRGKHGKGDVLFPTQVIVSRELERRHSSLRILRKHAEEADVRQFLEEAVQRTEQGDRANASAVLQVSVSANMGLYAKIREDDPMCQALEELMKDRIDAARDEGRDEGILIGRDAGIAALVDAYRTEMGLDNQSIIRKITSRFHLSGDQATAYVLPQGG